MLTEKEAKEKWCPYTYRWVTEEKRLTTRCIASECMAWRWGKFETEGTENTTKGYCGLAGKDHA